MADAAVRVSVSPAPRHTATVRISHWITVACFFALLVTGLEVVVSHPRFYWGEEGNVRTPALFSIPIPSSRSAVPTGYGFVLPDQNGWSRSLHFQSAWALVLTGWVYVIYGLFTRHFRPSPPAAGHDSYNPVQRLTYLAVVFLLFPAIVWTGLAMSPGVVSVFPWMVTVLGGHQSARTCHFVLSLVAVLFLVVHVVMVWRAGFRARTGAMITGRIARKEGL